jgi:glycosyltransferase involved in cell wall biosynthesis
VETGSQHGADSLDPMTALAPPVTGLAGVSIVLPCHNEEANVAAAVRMAVLAGALNALAYEVLVIDDGSRDGTYAVATRLAAGDPHVRVLRHDTNRGYGAALRTGIAAARQPWILLTDADLQFDLAELAAFVPHADEHDLVAGYRRQRRDPARRRLAAAAWNRLVTRTLGIRVRDVDCAFKLVRRSLLADVELVSDGAAISAELFARCRDARVYELAVEHRARAAGRQSGMRPHVVLRAFVELLRLRREVHRGLSARR